MAKNLRRSLWWDNNVPIVHRHIVFLFEKPFTWYRTDSITLLPKTFSAPSPIPRCREAKLYRCHSFSNWFLCRYSPFYRYTVNHAKIPNIFPVLSWHSFIYLPFLENSGSESCQLHKHLKITYPCRGERSIHTSAGGEGDLSD